MKYNESLTVVGVPFYEAEGQGVLDATVGNIEGALCRLSVDAEIWIMVNGPNTQRGNPPAFSDENRSANVPVRTFFSDERGQVAAIDEMVRMAQRRKIGRMFITDADIYRFPNSLELMWHGSDKPLVGAQYRPYPLEVVSDAYPDLTHEERLLYEIFDGDQKPEIREELRASGLDRSPRIKGSLMLLDVHQAAGMHQGNTAASDSAINLHFGPQLSEIVPGARFMHMGRLSATDHIMARSRHYAGAAQRGDMQRFLAKQVKAPDVASIERIANTVRANYENGDYLAMLYLARCALREEVDTICTNIAYERWEEIPFGQSERDQDISMRAVKTFEDAKKAVSRLLRGVDWDAVCGFSSTLPPTTQVDMRAPLDLERYVQDPTYKSIIENSFLVDGVEEARALTA